jgi:hypothetical protein
VEPKRGGGSGGGRPRRRERNSRIAEPVEEANPILLLEDRTMTKALRHRAVSRLAPKVEPGKKAVRTPKAPGMPTVKERLAALSAADMPWLRKGVDLTPPDGGPEVCGPAVYRAGKSAVSLRPSRLIAVDRELTALGNGLESGLSSSREALVGAIVTAGCFAARRHADIVGT